MGAEACQDEPRRQPASQATNLPPQLSLSMATFLRRPVELPLETPAVVAVAGSRSYRGAAFSAAVEPQQGNGAIESLAREVSQATSHKLN